MSFDSQPDTRPDLSVPPPLLPALFAGLGAAVLGAIGWTVIMALTGYEIGFAAWAMGGLVGFAMQKATTLRGTVAAGSASAMALVGLLIARVLIGEFVLGGAAVDEVLADDELMLQAATLDMQFSSSFPADVQGEYDALADSDTIPDALWDRMLAAAEVHLDTLPEEERILVAEQLTGLSLSQIGLWGRVRAQLGPYDALWALLAVSTAWGMMKKKEEEVEVGDYDPDPQ